MGWKAVILTNDGAEDDKPSSDDTVRRPDTGRCWFDKQECCAYPCGDKRLDASEEMAVRFDAMDGAGRERILAMARKWAERWPEPRPRPQLTLVRTSKPPPRYSAAKGLEAGLNALERDLNLGEIAQDVGRLCAALAHHGNRLSERSARFSGFGQRLGLERARSGKACRSLARYEKGIVTHRNDARIRGTASN